MLSCTLCNQRHKGNFFPLLDNSKRAKNHHASLADETPLFINPTLQNPENYISFREEIPFAINDNEYGKHTISFLGLDREELNEQRLEKYNELQMLLEAIFIARQYPAISELKSYADKASVKIEDMKKIQAKYSAMIKAALNSPT